MGSVGQILSDIRTNMLCMVQQGYLDNVNWLSFLLAEYPLGPNITIDAVRLQLLGFESAVNYCSLPHLRIFNWWGNLLRFRGKNRYVGLILSRVQCGKQIHAFRGKNNEILLECVLLSFNKITVLKV